MAKNKGDEADIFVNIPWVTVRWRISNFFSRKSYESSEFSFHGKNFRLKLQLVASKNIRKDSYEIYIEESDKSSEHTLELITRSNFMGPPEELKIESLICFPNPNGCSCIWKAPRQYLLKSWEKQESESLTFTCTIDLQSENIEEEDEDLSAVELKGLENLSLDFEDFLTNRILDETADITFKRGENYFYAHSTILSARCGKFAEKVQKKSEECVEINDMDSSVIADFLQYVYAGSLYNFTGENILQLYDASFTYDFIALRRACGRVLAKNLSVYRACTCLSLAAKYNDKHLKETVISYLVKASKDFWESETWLKFCANNSKLACEVYKSLENIKILLKP